MNIFRKFMTSKLTTYSFETDKIMHILIILNMLWNFEFFLTTLQIYVLLYWALKFRMFQWINNCIFNMHNLMHPQMNEKNTQMKHILYERTKKSEYLFELSFPLMFNWWRDVHFQLNTWLLTNRSLILIIKQNGYS